MDKNQEGSDIKSSDAAKIAETAIDKAADKIVEVYQATIRILNTAIGNSSSGSGLIPALMALLMYADLLHGGAYNAPISEIPYFMQHPETSPYFDGDIKNDKTSLFGITIQGSDFQEIIDDSAVPHILPKLLSDQAYARLMVLYGQGASGQLFTVGTQGVSTLVQAADTLIAPNQSARGESPSDLQALLALMRGSPNLGK